MKISITELDIKDVSVDRSIKFLKQSFMIKDELKKLEKFEQAFIQRFNGDESKQPDSAKLMNYSYEDSKKTVSVIENMGDFISHVLHKESSKTFAKKMDNLNLEQFVMIFEKVATAIQMGDIDLDEDSVAQAKSGKK